MIPVNPAPEPPNFHAWVRQPGKAWIHAQGFAGLARAPPRTRVQPYWTRCLPDLLAAYDRICSYASLRIPGVVGAPSTEHFAPKSRALPHAYEWINYRLACAKLNARKNNFTDVLDPFTLAPDTFRLNTLNGSIYPNPQLPPGDLAAAERTRDRLKLDDLEMRETRLFLITKYLNGDFSEAHLKSESPFIWLELQRLGQL